MMERNLRVTVGAMYLRLMRLEYIYLLDSSRVLIIVALFPSWATMLYLSLDIMVPK